ncbi:MAG: hypothetical protein U0L88_05475 [Acutalibacteraceae bacterium]|nr:hypothetical protein [Acutalibacteraceae bacterium]
MAPQAIYPAYSTEVIAKGEYVIGCKVLYTSTGKMGEAPEVTIDGTTVAVTQYDKKVTFNLEV